MTTVPRVSERAASSVFCRVFYEIPSLFFPVTTMSHRFPISLLFVFCAVLFGASSWGISETTAEEPQKDASAAASEKPKWRRTDPETVTLSKLDSAMLRGVKFLLERQNKNGSWGSARLTKRVNVYAPGDSHQGYLTGTTALALESLLRVERLLQNTKAPETPELAELRKHQSEIATSIDRGEAWVFENLPKLRRSSPDVLYNNWGHAYGLQTLCEMYVRQMTPALSEADQKARQEKIRAQMQTQLELLGRFECLDGGWCYYDFDYMTQHTAGSPSSFVTSTVLVAMAAARECGAEVPDRLIQRAIASLLRQRRPDGTFAYGEYVAKYPVLINRPPGSLGRSQAGNIALASWGRGDIITQEVYRDWLDRLVKGIGWLDIGRERPMPHESHFQIAAYFYYYAHYYASMCVDQVQDTDAQRHYAKALGAILLDVQQKNGSWWDFPLYDYHFYYGTGMAVTALTRLRGKL